MIQGITPLNSLLANNDEVETGKNVSKADETRYSIKTNGTKIKRAKRVAVIGAGFSGLTAAAELKRLGKDIT